MEYFILKQVLILIIVGCILGHSAYKGFSKKVFIVVMFAFCLFAMDRLYWTYKLSTTVENISSHLSENRS